MKEKDIYTLDELYANLDISLFKLSRIADVTEPTLARIRDGYSARRETVNKLLKGFSKVYERELSLENVTGITFEDKKAIRKQMLERKGIPEKAEKAEKVRDLPEVRQAKAIEAKASKRALNRKQDTSLPDGCILASKFAENHGVARPTFIDHMLRGLGPGLIGTSTDTIPQRDQVDYSERVKPNRPKEKEKYLTSDQQSAAIQFWKRHGVPFTECDQTDCSCHTSKSGE